MRVLAAYGLQFGRYRITQMAKHKTQYDNRAWHGFGRELGRCVPPAAPELAHPWASAVAWAASGVSRDREISGNRSWVAWE